MGLPTAAAVGLAALGTGAQVYNTRQTAKREDNAAASSIRKQNAIQQEADARVNQQVENLQGSTADAQRTKRLNQYMDALRRGRGQIEAGLAPVIGSDEFRADSAAAASGLGTDAANTAGLLSRIDAAGLQRQDEATGYGNLATDLRLVGRKSAGQAFIDDLRRRSIQRNPWLDLAGGLATTAGSSGLTGGWGNGVGNGIDGSAAISPNIYGRSGTYAGGRLA